MNNPCKHPDFKKEAEYLQAKREAAIAWLGDRWILSKANQVQRKDEKK